MCLRIGKKLQKSLIKIILSINVASFRRGSRDKFFLKWALKSKKQNAKNYCNTKMPQHFHRLFSVLKIELKTNFCFLKYHLMSLNAKKILEHIFSKFYMWKISILKKFPVFRPLFRRRRLKRRGKIFLIFFFTFWKITSSTTNVASFRRGSRAKIFFK